jgi:hypothetical protein
MCNINSNINNYSKNNNNINNKNNIIIIINNNNNNNNIDNNTNNNADYMHEEKLIKLFKKLFQTIIIFK